MSTLSAATGLVPQTLQPLLGKAPTPQRDRLDAETYLGGDLLVFLTHRGQQDNPASLDIPHRSNSRAHDGFQFSPFTRKLKADR